GDAGEPECPQLFLADGRAYLVASLYDRAVGGPTYWFADGPRGPWHADVRHVLDGKDLCAAQVAWDGRRWLLMGWVPEEPARPGAQHWGGHLALPRELFVLPDGRLGTRLPSDLSVALRGERIDCAGEEPELPGPVDLSCDWKPNDENDRLELVFAVLPGNPPRSPLDTVDRSEGSETSDRFVSEPAVSVVLADGKLSIVDQREEVWSEIACPELWDARESKPVEVRCILDRDIVEVFVASRWSLVARVPHPLERFQWTVRECAPASRERLDRRAHQVRQVGD
ncbi:MAG: hypothetical protein KDA83_03685, partial [Planctomycetales bacterium]|nr:hypothetical protein [Planctomycetales bacterium]